MKRFKTHFNEGRYPTWIKVTSAALVLQVRSLSHKIATEKDLQKQNQLIAQQAKLISYMNGLAIAVGSSDLSLIRKLKQISKN